MHCPLCKNINIIEFKYINGYDVFKCSNCELIYVPKASEITDERIEEIYSEHYFNNPITLIGYSNYLYEESNHRKNAIYLLNKMRKYLNGKTLKILDVGCAHGFLLDEARKIGHEAYGVEISNEAYDYAINILNLKNIHKGTIFTAGYGKEFFDAIFIIGTIEHLRDPIMELKTIYTLLRPGGIVIITTAEINGFFPFFSIKPPEHLFYFTRKNIKRLLIDLKFKCVHSGIYFVRYRIADILEQFYKRTRLNIFKFLLSGKIKKFVSFSMRIPSDEMLVIGMKNKK